MIQTVKDISKRIVEKTEETTSVKEIANRMKDKNVSSLVVVDELGKPVGLVTERDLVRKVCTLDVLSKSVRIGEIMSSPVITITSDKSPSDAADVMLQKDVRHLLIIDKDKSNEFVGLITPLDFLRSQQSIVYEDKEAIEKVLDTYEAISYY
jgi:CBS domain-containing protein